MFPQTNGPTLLVRSKEYGGQAVVIMENPSHSPKNHWNVFLTTPALNVKKYQNYNATKEKNAWSQEDKTDSRTWNVSVFLCFNEEHIKTELILDTHTFNQVGGYPYLYPLGYRTIACRLWKHRHVPIIMNFVKIWDIGSGSCVEVPSSEVEFLFRCSEIIVKHLYSQWF